MIRRTIGAITLVCCVGVLAGCATTTPPVSFLYSPSVEAKGGSGELFLKTATANTPIGGASDVRWVIGKRKDSAGNVTGEIVSASSAEEMVIDALKRELIVAGYKVECGSVAPSGAAKVLDLDSLQLEIEETDGIPKIETTGTVRISIDVWKNGAKIKKLGYESRISDFAIIDRSRLQREIVEEGLRSVLGKAVPEIVAVLERKSVN